MHTSAPDFPWRKMIFILLAVAVWVSIPVIGYVTATSETDTQQCPNGPMVADLTGTAAGNTKAPSGTAQYREKNNNGLMVRVRNVTAAQGTSLTVYIDDTSVGTISLPRNGNGQLKLDTLNATINEGSTISVRNGTTTIMSGAFRCAGGGNTNGNTGGNTNTNGNTNGNTGGNTNGNANTHGNMNMNTNMNTNTNTNSNTNTNTNSNANSNANTTGTPRP